MEDFLERMKIRCELLSDFVYSFFEHNDGVTIIDFLIVVNCFQILYIRSLNTIVDMTAKFNLLVVNCFQILYIRSLNTIQADSSNIGFGCELLSDFVYSFFEHNG